MALLAVHVLTAGQLDKVYVESPKPRDGSLVLRTGAHAAGGHHYHSVNACGLHSVLPTRLGYWHKVRHQLLGVQANEAGFAD